MDRGVDADAGRRRGAADRRAVDAHHREARRGDLGEVQPERVDQEPVVASGHEHREVVRDALVEVEHHRDAERRGELDAGLTFIGRWVHRTPP